MRDRVVLLVLATGLVAVLLAWHFIGHWIALGAGLIAIGAACVAYRIERPRIDLDHPKGWEKRGAEKAQRIDQ